MQKLKLIFFFSIFEPNLSMCGYALAGAGDAIAAAAAAIPPAIGQHPT